MHLRDIFLLRTLASALRAGRRKSIVHRTMCALPEAISEVEVTPPSDVNAAFSIPSQDHCVNADKNEKNYQVYLFHF